ncbi:MAG: alkaline phosphatase [Kangiellaceae bacterium]|nr:alkaline phosphatase [Kangiellaceae bacterium]MCW9000282.1 alkaline phosphatase [Kangiellaceae bacterium]MCW9016719.1 alkaline phosphatase [Kangiellaceae bacterium]
MFKILPRLTLFVGAAFISSALLSGCSSNVVASFASEQSDLNSNSDHQSPKNIIFLVGDGMGPAAVKAYRMFKDDPNTPWEEKMTFDDYLVGSVNTNAIDLKENITDSAASATAYATGKKTFNGALSIDGKGNHFFTVIEKAKQANKSTGLVVTSEVVHATPAAFVAHHPDREQKKVIAKQYFENQQNGKPIVDVILGGGTKYFKTKKNDLIEKFKAKGYEYVTNKAELLSASGEELLGLFAKKGLEKYWDRKASTPSLMEMTQAALNRLSKNENGFFLLIEASQIDWAAHENDIVGVLSEMEEFELAAQLAFDFAKKQGDTLVIATADHNTGGLSIGQYGSGEGNYFWDLELIKSFRYTPAKITTLAQQSDDLIAEFHRATSMRLNQQEINYLNTADLSNWDLTRRMVAKVISDRSFTGWTTYGHTATDVFLYAYGPGAELLRGHLDNTRIGQVMLDLISR